MKAGSHLAHPSLVSYADKELRCHKESYAELSGRMHKLQNTLLQVGGGMIGALVVVFGSFVVAQI